MLVKTMIILILIWQSYCVSLSNLTEVMAYSSYKGQWVQRENQDVIHQLNIFQKQFDFLTGTQGDAYMIFLTNKTYFNQDIVVIDQINMNLLDPKYPEERQIFTLSNLDNYSSKTITWQGISQMNYSGYYKFKQKISQTCNVNYSVQVSFDGEENAENAIIKTQFYSDQCSINFNSTFSFDQTNYSLQIFIYCLYSCSLCLIQIFCMKKLITNLMERQQQDIQRVNSFMDYYLFKFSTIPISAIAIFHSYICFQNLYYGLVSFYFLIPAICYFFIAIIYDQKLMWMIWREHNAIEDVQALRRAAIYYLIYFNGSLVIFFILMIYLQFNNYFTCCFIFFITPQIVHNVIKGINPKFNYLYIYGILLPNAIYPIYFKGCPSNFKGLKPSLAYCIVWTSFFLLQIAILFFQAKLGPRCIIPKFLLPKPYNYYQILQVINEEIDECAICLTSLLMEPDQMEQNLDQQLLKKKIMVTPCQHKFHITCLKSWMDVKLNCPTCRKVMPPLVE